LIDIGLLFTVLITAQVHVRLYKFTSLHMKWLSASMWCHKNIDCWQATDYWIWFIFFVTKTSKPPV